MRLRSAACLLASLAIASLAACQRDAPAAARAIAASSAASGTVAMASAAVPSSIARGAQEGTPNALMREAFPEWGGQKAFVTTIVAVDPKEGPLMVAISPLLVVPVDETDRMLLTQGMPSDERGQFSGGHPTEGVLGAYSFVLRNGRWFVSHRQDAVLSAGTFGKLGKVESFDLGGGHRGVSVRGGGCWQGSCAELLDVVELDANVATVALEGVPIMSETEGVTPECGAVLRGEASASIPKDWDVATCFNTDGALRTEPRDGAARADIVIHFTGHELASDVTTKALSVRTVDQTQVFRYSAGKYQPLSGRNPTHPI